MTGCRRRHPAVPRHVAEQRRKHPGQRDYLSRANPRTDFGPGFYTTSDPAQALARAGGDASGVLEFRLPASALDGLAGRVFAGADDAYVDFLRSVRSQGTHPFDYVSGPVLRNPRGFYAGKDPVTFGDQTSFHTPEAIRVLYGGIQ